MAFGKTSIQASSMFGKKPKFGKTSVGAVTKIGQAANDFFKQARNKIEAMSSEKKAALLSMPSFTARAALSTPGYSPTPAETPAIVPSRRAGQVSQLVSPTVGLNAPTQGVRQESKLARRMRSRRFNGG